MAGLALKKCHKCEGYGKVINQFDLPVNEEKRLSSVYSVYRDNQFTVDGRMLSDWECDYCHGSGTAVYGSWMV